MMLWVDLIPVQMLSSHVPKLSTFCQYQGFTDQNDQYLDLVRKILNRIGQRTLWSMTPWSISKGTQRSSGASFQPIAITQVKIAIEKHTWHGFLMIHQWWTNQILVFFELPKNRPRGSNITIAITISQNTSSSQLFTDFMTQSWNTFVRPLWWWRFWAIFLNSVAPPGHWIPGFQYLRLTWSNHEYKQPDKCKN